MLGRSFVLARKASPMGVRTMSSLPSMLYNNVWRKSTRLYLTYIATGCIVLGGIYESATEGIWRAMNSGKLYDQVDWSKWNFADADDE